MTKTHEVRVSGDTFADLAMGKIDRRTSARFKSYHQYSIGDIIVFMHVAKCIRKRVTGISHIIKRGMYHTTIMFDPLENKGSIE